MPLGSVPKTMSGSGAIPNLLCCQGIAFDMSVKGDALLTDDNPNQRAAMRAEAAVEVEGIENSEPKVRECHPCRALWGGRKASTGRRYGLRLLTLSFS